MSTLSKPFYNSNNRSTQLPGEAEDSSFKVLGTSFDTPYDTAKKRNSQQVTSAPVPAPTSNQSDQIIQEYQIDNNRKKTAYHVKLVVVGDGGCGKTCLLISYSQGKFPEAYVPTIFENYITTVTGPNNKAVELALWDTAGQEEYDRLRPLSYPDVNVLIICYAVNSPISLNNIKEKWAPEVSHFCPGIPIILVGTKTDLIQSSDSIIDFEEAEQIAAEIGASYHIRCSAKTTENIKQVFNVAITAGLEKVLEGEQAAASKKKKNRFSRKPAQNQEENVSSQFASDYYGNTEYGISELPTLKKRRRIPRKCVIL